MNFNFLEPNKTILLLNADYNPIHVILWRRAIVLVLKERAQIISSRVIRLVNYIKLPFDKFATNRPNRNMVMKRDDYRCQYCGSIKNLTIDHIIPTSKGGKNTWDNLITACISCNYKKGDKSLKESGMFLYSKPSIPFNKIVLTISKSNVAQWKEYIYN